jgi:hypothetical protein
MTTLPSKGSSEEEIERLERKIGFRLPLAFNQYLLWVGEDNTLFNRDWSELRFILTNTLYLKNELAEAGPESSLPAYYLCFLVTEEGMSRAWFELPRESENPKVYEYYDDGEKIIEFESFTTWLQKELRMS